MAYPDQPHAGTVIQVRRRAPETFTAYQVPDDVSLPPEWSEDRYRNPLMAQPAHGRIVVMHAGYETEHVSPGDWIVRDPYGRFEVWPDQYFWQRFKRSDRA